MRLIIESIDLFILGMINHDKSLESFNSDAVKSWGGWENRWYYLEQLMSSWWVKMKQELLAMFLNSFTLIECLTSWVECKSCKKWVFHLKISKWYNLGELVPLIIPNSDWWSADMKHIPCFSKLKYHNK